MVRLVTASSPVADPSSVSHRLMPQPREFRDSPALHCSLAIVGVMLRWRSFSSLVSHFGTASSDQFEIRIVINNRLRLQLVVGQCVQGGLLLSLGVGDDQHSAGASQAYAG
jgi:hypothetical protein